MQPASLLQWVGRWTEDLFLSIRTRVILSYLVIVLIGFLYLVHRMSNEVRPRYLEAQEEIMVDIANLLAAQVEPLWGDAGPDLTELRAALERTRQRKLGAKIYALSKDDLDLHLYLTDARGRVLFDSADEQALGRDYSRWNDVHLTLQGRYGARATRTVEHDSGTTILYVGAPIRHGGEIVGVLTVSKSLANMTGFMERTRGRILLLGSAAACGVALMGALFSAWITYPIRNLTQYAKAVRDGRPATLPFLGHSEIRTLGLAFEEMRDALEGKDYINRYVQTLTHEIKSPIAAIRGAAELLQEEMPAEDRHRFLANIQAETGRIQEAIDSLLLLAAVESKKTLGHAAEVNLRVLLNQAAGKIADRAALKAVKITRDLGTHPEARVWGDAFLLERIFLNLLENAVAFSPQGGAVHLRLRRDPATGWNIAIEDSGPGIPEYALERVFERFYSLPRPDTGKKSSGLGLAFVKEAILLHGGRVELHNRAEGGTRAILLLP